MLASNGLIHREMQGVAAQIAERTPEAPEKTPDR
jgi:hypothetical protein